MDAVERVDGGHPEPPGGIAAVEAGSFAVGVNQVEPRAVTGQRARELEDLPRSSPNRRRHQQLEHSDPPGHGGSQGPNVTTAVASPMRSPASSELSINPFGITAATNSVYVPAGSVPVQGYEKNAGLL